MHGRNNKQSSDSMIFVLVWVDSVVFVKMYEFCMLMEISLSYVTGCAE